MSILKSAAWLLNGPLMLALIFTALGLVLLRASLRRLGLWVIGCAAVFGFLASTTLVGDALLAPLERQYPAFEPGQAAEVHDIVVLGSGYEPFDQIPVTGALDPDGLARIVEGVRLARLRPDSRLIVSGGALPGHSPIALGYAHLAADLGIEPSVLVTMDRARTTDQEAREVAALLGHTPFILVTSAYHMPRAVILMRRAGANPVPAPTGQIVHLRQDERFGLVPGSRGLHRTETALHEYLGLAAAGLRVD